MLRTLTLAVFLGLCLVVSMQAKPVIAGAASQDAPAASAAPAGDAPALPEGAPIADPTSEGAPAPKALPARQWLGHGRIFNNDLFADLKDRWQTGSVSGSHARGRVWTGTLPDRPFALMEYRLSGQVMAPANLRNPGSGDRPFVGALSFGAHTHFMRGELETALGLELVAIGPQTGLDDLQTAIHEGIGAPVASDATLGGQLDNAFIPGLVAEIGRTRITDAGMHVRPFAELRAGPETLLRAGLDLSLGDLGTSELLVRDSVTGQRYRVIRDPKPGVMQVLGGDLAVVDSSRYLPASSGVTPARVRARLRAGVHRQGESSAVFFGLTWLSPEFQGQSGGQFIGSIRLRREF